MAAQILIEDMKRTHGNRWAEKLLELFEDLGRGQGWPYHHFPEEVAYRLYTDLFDWIEEAIKEKDSANV